MSVYIRPEMIDAWLQNCDLDNTKRTLGETHDLLRHPEYREFALKLIQKFIGKARHELSQNESPFPPKELEFQIDCKLEFSQEERAVIVLGCCGAGGGTNCLPCFDFEVGTGAQMP